jgi:hypothetical protein
MNARHFFTGVILLIISLITTSMIVPRHMLPSPQLTLQEFLIKRAFIYTDNAKLEAIGHRKLTGMEKIVFKKIRIQFRKELQKQHLLGNCDTVVMKDGSKFKAIVTEVKPSEIFYKMCDDPEGPTFSIKTAALSHIQYANGSKVDYQPKEKETSSITTKNTNQDTDPLAIAAFATGLGSLLSILLSSITGFLGFIGFFGFIAAFILGLMSLRNIKKSKGKLKGRGMAITGLIIGIGGILIFALAILLIVLLVSSIP